MKKIIFCLAILTTLFLHKSSLAEQLSSLASVDEWQMPAFDSSNPYGMAIDSNNRLWIAETGKYPNNIVIFDTKQKNFISSTKVESGGSIRHMYYDAHKDKIWFGVDTGYISRIGMSNEH